jgi:predicted outer membrane protein
MRKSILSVVILSALTLPVWAQIGGTTQVQQSKDKQFLQYVSEDNQAEIRLCQNAEKLGQSPAIIAFARLVVDDDTANQRALDELLSKNEIKVQPEMVQQQASMVAPKIGVNFDGAFIAAQIEHHQNDVLRFQNEESAAQSEDVRQIASQSVIQLQQQLAVAQAVQAWLASPQAQVTGRTDKQ